VEKPHDDVSDEKARHAAQRKTFQTSLTCSIRMILRQLALFAAGARHVSGLRLEDGTPAATLLQVRDCKNMISRHIMVAGNGPALSDSLYEADLDPVCERRKMLGIRLPPPLLTHAPAGASANFSRKAKPGTSGAAAVPARCQRISSRCC
jgi:hypothetical protein